jgi:hypothetical protein
MPAAVLTIVLAITALPDRWLLARNAIAALALAGILTQLPGRFALSATLHKMPRSMRRSSKAPVEPSGSGSRCGPSRPSSAALDDRTFVTESSAAASIRHALDRAHPIEQEM